MTDFYSRSERINDQQDGIERHIYGKLEYVDGGGSVVRVKGTGSQDEEAIVLSIGGQGLNLAEDANAEVYLISGGSDTNMKYAILTIPHDLQRQWAEGTGGIQHPTDPTRALEFNANRTHLTDPNFAVGPNGVFEVTAAGVTIRGDVTVTGSVVANQLQAPHDPVVLNGTPVDGGFTA